MKKILCFTASALCAAISATALQLPTFSGNLGFLGEVTPEPTINAQSYFAGQIDFSGRFLFRTEFSVAADSLQDSINDASNVQSAFNIQEISGTFNFSTGQVTHYVSAFLGEFEPIGSDIFLKRQFGVQSISSNLMDSWHSYNGASAYPFYGLGASYALHIVKNYATALYVSRNTDSVTGVNSLDTNLRFATVSHSMILDVATGLSFVLGESGGIFSIDTITLHGGLNLLAGNRNFLSFFLQAGVSDYTIDAQSGHKFNNDSIYVLFEPRLVLNGFHIAPSAFILPFEAQNKMLFLHYPEEMITDDDANKSSVGANLNIYKEDLYVGITDITVGGHLTLSFPGSNAMTLIPNIMAGDSHPQLTISPYLATDIFGGSLMIAFTVDEACAFKKGIAQEKEFKKEYPTFRVITNLFRLWFIVLTSIKAL
ncbi:MAG: hypothetical protein II054_10410, partial [Treponema sp.]|nr:hypothetical protein [Treponema sp.]